VVILSQFGSSDSALQLGGSVGPFIKAGSSMTSSQVPMEVTMFPMKVLFVN